MEEQRLWAPSPPRPGRPRIDRRRARELIDWLRRDGARIASRFGLTYRAIEAERSSVRTHFGICYEDGLIKIRLHHATRGTALKYSSLVNTLCHELAHLKHFDHGDAFQTFYARLLGWARSASIYRPSPRRTGMAVPSIEDCSVSEAERRRFLGRLRAAAEAARHPPAGPQQLGLFGGPE